MSRYAFSPPLWKGKVGEPGGGTFQSLPLPRASPPQIEVDLNEMTPTPPAFRRRERTAEVDCDTAAAGAGPGWP